MGGALLRGPAHSLHFSRACSRDCDLEHLAWWAGRKGIAVVGTGDFTHPGWREELGAKLVPDAPGLFRLRPDLERAVHDTLPPACRTPVRFMLSSEISTIYKRDDRTRKVHHLLYAPSLEAVDEITRRAGPGGEPRLGRQADPRARLARTCSRSRLRRRRLLPGARARVDAVVRGARLAVRVRPGGGLLRGPGGPHLRHRDRLVVRPGDELAGLQPGRVPAGVQLRRALPADARPGGDGVRRWTMPTISRSTGVADRGGLRRDGRVLPRRGQVPPRRPPRLRRADDAGGDPGGRRQVPGLREDADDRRAAPGRRAGRPAGGLPACQARRGSRRSCRCRRSSARSPASARSPSRSPPRSAPWWNGSGRSCPSSATCRSTTWRRGAPSIVAEAIARLRRGEVRREAGYDGVYGTIRLFDPAELAGAALFDLPARSASRAGRRAAAAAVAPEPPVCRRSPRSRDWSCARRA